MNILRVTLLFLFLPLACLAKEQEYYVDSSFQGAQKGTLEEPFNNLGIAVDVAKNDSSNKKTIFVKGGVYYGDFTVNDHIGIVGLPKEQVSINGIVEMEDDSLFRNIKFIGDSGIRVREDANVSIENCSIDTDRKVGVRAFPGTGKITVHDSEIVNRGGKGLYIEKGRSIDIENSSVTAGSEEGLDIRSKVKGKVLNCIFENNGESGIELIAGGSELEIRNNVFRGNQASGIAVQYYSFANEEGKITLANNTFENNRKFGIDCLITEGAKPEANYWFQSINLDKNKFSGNGKEKINKSCNYSGPIDEEDEKIRQQVAKEFEMANVEMRSNEKTWKEQLLNLCNSIWQKIEQIFDF